MKPTRHRRLLLPLAPLLAGTLAASPPAKPAADPAKVPGIVIDHLPASSGLYVGSPSIAILPDGAYVASHDHFGPQMKERRDRLTSVFRSRDRGRTWEKIADLDGQFWSTLFVHRGALYIVGVHVPGGQAIIRRSADGGATWTRPTDGTTGLLRENIRHHCAPVPVVVHNGRIWRAMEDLMGPGGWGTHFRALMMSAPEDADLLKAASWTFTEPIGGNPAWLDGGFGGWLEGNAVVAPDGRIVNILRVATRTCPEKAAIIGVTADGKSAQFDPARGFIDFPGGAKKFTIRPDPKGGLYWSLASIAHSPFVPGTPGGIRNTLALTCSSNLMDWTVRCILLHHPDTVRHGFQYVDWQFDGDDMIAACRTGFDDGLGGAHNAHDANFLTFHRIANFRALTLADSAAVMPVPISRHETGDLMITGAGFEIARLDEGATAFSNRAYIWNGVPEDFQGWSYTRTGGGEPAAIGVRATRDTTLHVATTPAHARKALPAWRPTGTAFAYTDRGMTGMAIFTRPLRGGQEIMIPQGNWTGTLVLVPTGQTPPDPKPTPP